MTDDERSQDVVRLITAGRDREAAQRALAQTGRAATTPARHRNGGTMDPLTQLSQLAQPLGDVVAGISPDQLERATPCAEFSVRGILEHMIGGATTFAAAFRGQPPPPDADVSDVLGGFGPALSNLGAAMNDPGALERTVAAPFGDVDGETFARFVILDGLVHGWDLATATGQRYDPPDALVAAADGFARQALDPLRDGQTFADAVEPAADATPIERLVAYTGRRPLSQAS